MVVTEIHEQLLVAFVQVDHFGGTLSQADIQTIKEGENLAILHTWVLFAAGVLAASVSNFFSGDLQKLKILVVRFVFEGGRVEERSCVRIEWKDFEVDQIEVVRSFQLFFCGRETGKVVGEIGEGLVQSDVELSVQGNCCQSH